MRRRTWLSPRTFLAVLLLLTAAPAGAQQGTTEAGVDARLGLVFVDDADDVTLLQVPVPLIRIGYMITPSLMVEPAFRFVYAAREGANTSSQHLFVSLLWHNRQLTDRPVYVGGGLGLERAAFGDDSDTEALLGARLGIKPSLAPDVLARVGLQVTHGFDGFTEFGIEVGVSLLIR